MLSVTVKGLWAQKVRFALTGLAVVLGVAFMTGTMVLTATMQRTFDGVFASANRGTDVIVRRGGSVQGDVSVVRDRLDAPVVTRVAAVDGVRAARGSIEEVTQLVRSDGTVTKTEGINVAIGTNWIDDATLNPFTLATGHAPAALDEVVVDQRTARHEHWSLGARLSVLTKSGPETLRLVGIATFGKDGKLAGRPGSTLVATNDATAQRLFGQPGRYDSVLVDGVAGLPPAALQARILASVATPGSGLEAVTGAQGTVDQQAGLKDQLHFFTQFLMAFAFVALFVGSFIIYNTFSIVVAQRSRDLARLRALGARRRQVVRSVLLESALVGILCAAIGVAAGVGLSFAMRAAIGASGLEVPNGAMVLSIGTVATAFAVGVAVSVLSAVVPARRAGRIPPMAALRDTAEYGTERTRRSSMGRIVIGGLMTAAGVACFAMGVSASGGALPLIGGGTLLTVLGVCTLGPVLVRPAVRILGLPLRGLGVTGRYARDNAARHPKRTNATASALMVGIALVGFITVLAASAKSSVEAFVDRSFRSDYVVESGSASQGFSSAIETDVRRIRQVTTLSPERVAPAEVSGKAAPVIGLDTSAIDRLYDLGVSSGSIAAVRGDGVAVSKTKASAAGVRVGDRVPFRFADGSTQTLTVRAVFDGNSVGGDADWLVGLDTYEAHVADQFDRRLFVKFEGTMTPAASRAALGTALQRWPNASVQDRAEFRAAIASKIDALLNLVYGLLGLALLIALIGIANTLALSVHERRQELGLLRALGMRRRQVRRAVRWESALIAVYGTLLGIGLGIGGAWGIVRALSDQGITRFVVPAGPLAIIVTMAGVAAIVAAAGPARRASKLRLLNRD